MQTYRKILLRLLSRRADIFRPTARIRLELNGYISGTDLNDSLVLLTKTDLVVINVEDGTVTFNPWDFQVTQKNFESFAKLLLKRYDFLEIHRLVEEYTGLWILEVTTRIPHTAVDALDDAIKNSYYLLAYEIEETDLLRLIAEIQLLRQRSTSLLASRRYVPTIPLGKLRDVIEEVATVVHNLQIIEVPSE